ncbi:MAG: hypothetical protein ABII39_07670 [Candidatus Micrarchaeota archaeon]
MVAIQRKHIFTGLAVATTLVIATMLTCPSFSEKDPVVDNLPTVHVTRLPTKERSKRNKRIRNNRINNTTDTVTNTDTELIGLIKRTYTKRSIDCQEVKGTVVDNADDASYYLRYPPLKGELPIRYQNIEDRQLEDKIKATDIATLMRIIEHLANIEIIKVYDGLAIARPNEYLNKIIANRSEGNETSYDPVCLERSSSATVALVTALKELLLRSIAANEHIGLMIDSIPENTRPVMYDQLVEYLFGYESELEPETITRILDELDDTQRIAFIFNLDMIASVRSAYADNIYEFLGCTNQDSECSELHAPGSIVNAFSLYLVGEPLERMRK